MAENASHHPNRRDRSALPQHRAQHPAQHPAPARRLLTSLSNVLRKFHV